MSIEIIVCDLDLKSSSFFVSILVEFLSELNFLELCKRKLGLSLTDKKLLDLFDLEVEFLEVAASLRMVCLVPFFCLV